MHFSARNIARGGRGLSISKALFAYFRKEGPSGAVVSIGPIALTWPILHSRLAASSIIALGVRVPDSGRFEPSASA